MQPKLELLDDEMVTRVIGEARLLLRETGVKVQSNEARALLAEAGAAVDEMREVVKIPDAVVDAVLATVPRTFALHDASAEPSVIYGAGRVHFDPGSSAVQVLDPQTITHRAAVTSDLTRIVKIAESLPQIDAQSTAVVCDEVPKEVADLWRLYVVLTLSAKPIVTGSFGVDTLEIMLDMLAAMVGGREALAAQPRAVFDVCPSPPLIWSSFGAGNLIGLARAGVPAEMVSMPLAGAAGPVTLLGSITQHAAECLSGIVIHQLAKAGSPIVWGGAPAIFDMRKGTTPMGAVETAMIDASYSQVGHALGLPTHAYLGTSDAKIVDAQAGLESGISAVIGALAGVDMISGAGMMEFTGCQSPEKLVMDAEGIAMARRLLEGVELRTETLALEFFEGLDFKGDFLKQRATRDLFPIEQYVPSKVIDRDSYRGWMANGATDAWTRAKDRANEIVDAYDPPALDPAALTEMRQIVERSAKAAGMDVLPEVE
jgi:trimethylamine--corrinoid protein Co-methyltransferase